ncbi:MAG: glycosyltransferase [Eubacterium sp.]|nr:glycosyltransferase [Eubacterium sp.]
MKKVLFIMLSLYNGGAEKSLVNLLNELPKDKYDIDLLLFRHEGLFLSQVPENVNILETPKNLEALYKPLKECRADCRITKLVGTLLSRLKKGNTEAARGYRWINYYSPKIERLLWHYDVAIAYSPGEQGYYLIDKVDAVKKYIWVHNDYRKQNFSKEYDKPYFEKADGIVSVSEECVNILKEEFPEIKDRIFCIENITSSEVIKKRAVEFIPKEYGNEQVRIISIGRLVQTKRFDIAIEAAAVLKEMKIKFRWYILGDGEKYDELLNLIKKTNTEDVIKLIGVRENPYPYIYNADIMVQTSEHEGKSVALDEAKILAKPIVVTDYPTVRDQIKDGKEGIISPLNAEGVANKISTLIFGESIYNGIKDYLSSRDYGNRDEVEKYIELMEK